MVAEPDMTATELRTAREIGAITQAALAAACDIAPARISEYERGVRRITKQSAALLREGLRKLSKLKG